MAFKEYVRDELVADCAEGFDRYHATAAADAYTTMREWFVRYLS